jgi:ligand-binding SRPBCC domain-containing protein
LIYLLERTQWVPRPPGEVFAFFSDARNLEALTPGWLRFRILTPAPIRMEQGARIEYELAWRVFSIRWKTVIAAWDPPHRFVDVQVRGPYRLWEHTHLFTAENGGTRLADSVRYQLPFGPLGRIAHVARVRADLHRIFDYRAEAIGRMFT